MKRFVILLLLPFVFLIAVCQPVEKPVLAKCSHIQTDLCLQDTADTNTNITSNGVNRYRRTLKHAPTSCSVNQYFDKHEGRCLGTVGGGKVLYINDTVSCDTNTLKPHCTNPRYYYICKKNKIILAQCTHGRHFENHLQRCVHVSRDAYETVTVNPKTETFDLFQPPECKTPGSFPFPNDCAQFYVCETNGHRLHQNFFRCPENTAYDREMEMCVPSYSCKGAKNLPSMCTWSIHKEKLTIEEAERWLNIWPLNESRFANAVVNVSKNFTLNENGSVTICETIYVPGESNVTVTNVYETDTSTQSSNDVATTSVSYVKSTTSAFAEVSDKSDVITSTRRDVEMSRPSDIIDTVSNEAYPARAETAFVKETKEDRGDGGSPLETSTLAERSSKEKVTEVPIISTDQSTVSNRGKEMKVNRPLSDMTTSAEPVLKDQYSTREKVIESSSTEVANVHDDSTILPKKELYSSTEMDMHNIETSTNEPTLEMTTFKKPVSEDQYRTVAPEKSLVHTDPTVSNEQELPSITEKEMEANTSTNRPSSEISTSKEPVSEDQYRTVAPEKSLDPQSPIHNDPAVSNEHELPNPTEREMEDNTSINGPPSEISTFKGPVSEDQYSTVAPEKSPIHNDPAVSNEHELPSATEKEMEVNTEANINEPLSDMTTSAEHVLKDQYSTTEKVIESSSSTVANIQDDSTILPKRELSSSTEMDMHNIETSTNGPTLEMTTLKKPVSEDQYRTVAPEKSLDPQSPIHNDPAVSNEHELPNPTEREMEDNTSTNGPPSEISTFKGPVSEDQYSTFVPEKSPIHNDPAVSNEHELPSATEKEMEVNTEANINEPLSDMTTSAEHVLKDQYSTTEKVIESSSTVANIQDDSTILPKRELSSSTEMDKQHSETSTNRSPTFEKPVSEDQYSTVAPEKSPVHTNPTVSNEHKLPSITEKEKEANTEASINEPLSGMTTFTEPVLKDQYSTTEKMIESSSTVANIHDDPTMSANPSISSSTETSAENIVQPTESVSSNNNATYVNRMTTTSKPKNVHEFHEALTSTKATFVVNDTSSTTVSPNIKTANETFIDNAVPTSNVPVNTESTFSASEASESTTMKPITSPEELIANCMVLSSANGSLTSTRPGKSSNSADNETRSRSFDTQQNSHVTDNDETKENDARKGIDTAPKTEYHGKTISKHVVLPIASAVLNITDKYERRLKYSLRNFLSRHALEHKKYT
ncbi:hypothetical protein ANTPLA_LOCUS4769 [Anthophora plagiata]